MFVQAFGITRPTEAQRRRVTVLLGGTLLTAVVVFLLIVTGMVIYLHTSH
jgi:hypothetical protein